MSGIMDVPSTFVDVLYYSVFVYDHGIYVGKYEETGQNKTIISKTDLNFNILDSYSYPIYSAYTTYELSQDENFIYFCEFGFDG